MNRLRKLQKCHESILGLPYIEYAEEAIFTQPYPFTCCLEMNCNDICCSGGATMDRVIFDALRPYRENFPDIPWESFHFSPDPDSPGGEGCYTLFPDNRCMFQNREKPGCRIHSFCLEEGIDYRELKFFTCCLFPCEVNSVAGTSRVLARGYELRMPGFNPPCREKGESTVYRVARDNLAYYYGPQLTAELDLLEQDVIKENQYGKCSTHL